MFVTLLLVKLKNKYQFISIITDTLLKKLFYNSLLRYAIQSYIKYCEASFNSFMDINFDTPERTMNLPIAILGLLFVLGFPVFTFYFMRTKVAANKGNRDFLDRYNSLFFTLNTLAPLALYQTTMFLVRRLLLVAAVVFFKHA